MMQPQYYTVNDRHDFDVVIDVRSPAEFMEDHIPGAINCPVLSNEERHIVGVLHKQHSPFQARKVGGAMVARNIALHLETLLNQYDKKWRPLVYCWRGGLRSGSFVQWLRLVGWDAHTIKGGYKTWRHHVLEELEQQIPKLNLRVLSGATGTAKTKVLHALHQQNQQIIDLEGLALHRGSVLGMLPNTPQPSQKFFETQLLHTIEQLDLSRPIWIEAESKKIGNIRLPLSLVAQMHKSPVTELVASEAQRVQFLLEEYDWLTQEPELFKERLMRLKEIVSGAVLEQWLMWIENSAWDALFMDLIQRHYDPLYTKSHQRNYPITTECINAASLDQNGIQQLSDALIKSLKT